MNKKPNFYITTPLYYPNAKLHLGHAYTTILADIFARYKKWQKYKTFFETGSDDHGEKIVKIAQSLNIDPQKFVDAKALEFKQLWKGLGINYDNFLRTSSKKHQVQVQKIFSDLLLKKRIYQGLYQGLYCKYCSEFLTKNQINNDNNCKNCLNTPTQLSEETYFFKITDYQKFLKKLLVKKDFLLPVQRQNEMLNNFVNNNLHDFSIARNKISWGIPILENSSYVIYVWFDALLNYITALNYKTKDEKQLFQTFWSENTTIVHFIGKEITRFHTIYWPVLLDSLNLRMPDKIISHGWIKMQDHKMSKSLGNVIDPWTLINRYGRDAVRSFTVFRNNLYQDSSYSNRLFLNFYNDELANNFGNLFSRVTQMINKYYSGLLHKSFIQNELLFTTTHLTLKNYENFMDHFNINEAIEEINSLINTCNKAIEITKPWKLYKNDDKKLDNFINSLVYALIVIAHLIHPILIDTAETCLKHFGIKEKLDFQALYDENIIFTNKQIKKISILFQRLDIEKELQELKSL